ncbi:hypothetical protein RSAG8_06600, partial [Rhizoctonia solani AG-8 WAC10335]
MSSFTEKLVDFDIMVERKRVQAEEHAGDGRADSEILPHQGEPRFLVGQVNAKQTFLVRGTRKFGHRVYGSIPGICVAKLLYKYWAKIQGVKTGYYIFGWLVVYLFLGINTRLIVSFPQCPVLRALAQESRACQSL